MEAHHVATLRAILASTRWGERTEEFAEALRLTRSPGGLLLLGTPEAEPWHLAAHLADESRYARLPQLAPTLVRWDPPAGAPAHLRIGMDRLAQARRGETLFVVSPEEAPAPLLERVDDARRTGATILALEQGEGELRSLAHDAISLEPGAAPLSFDGLQHLVSAAAGTPARLRRRAGVRERLSRFLDVVSGPRIPE